jgi:hypothetical protein
VLSHRERRDEIPGEEGFPLAVSGHAEGPYSKAGPTISGDWVEGPSGTQFCHGTVLNATRSVVEMVENLKSNNSTTKTNTKP